MVLKQAKTHISKIESPISREIRIIGYVPKSIIFLPKPIV